MCNECMLKMSVGESTYKVIEKEIMKQSEDYWRQAIAADFAQRWHWATLDKDWVDADFLNEVVAIIKQREYVESPLEIAELRYDPR